MQQNIIPISRPNTKPTVLAVDDDRAMLLMLTERLEQLGYNVITAANGIQALEKLNEYKEHIATILLDREMPQLNGLQVVQKMKQDNHFRKLPVIMLTGYDKPEQVEEGIDAGVFYYLTKPINETILKSILSAAVREYNQHHMLDMELKKHKNSFMMVDNVTFHLRTIDEAESLARFVANCYPEPEKVLLGISELLVNAVEHGNLGITYDEKTLLIEQNIWREEIESRLMLAHNRLKFVTASFFKREYGYYIKVKDMGAGFNWRKYMEIDPSRANDNHGRGIAQANAISFDKLIYNEAGNEATGFVSNEKELDW